MLDTCASSSARASKSTYLDAADNGLITIAQLEAALRPDTILVSVMLVNNEIGVIQPIDAIGELCRTQGHHFPLRRRAGHGQGRDRPRSSRRST